MRFEVGFFWDGMGIPFIIKTYLFNNTTVETEDVRDLNR